MLVGFQGGRGVRPNPSNPPPPPGYGNADGMIKGGITQIEMAQRIAYQYSHLVSFILSSLVEVSSLILSNNHTFINMLLEFDY